MDNFDTPLPPERYSEFMDWIGKTGKNPDLEKEAGYDIQGYFLNKDKYPPFPNGHLTDRFKKPNHITFSDESIYHGKDGYEGGQWKEIDGIWHFYPGKTNLEKHGKQKLFEYFRRFEPESVLELPNE